VARKDVAFDRDYEDVRLNFDSLEILLRGSTYLDLVLDLSYHDSRPGMQQALLLLPCFGNKGLSRLDLHLSNIAESGWSELYQRMDVRFDDIATRESEAVYSNLENQGTGKGLLWRVNHP
jgi:hypothetical protein